MVKPFHIAIVGPGQIGGFLAAALAASGMLQLSLMGRRQEEITGASSSWPLEQSARRYQSVTVNLTVHSDLSILTQVDLVILTVKATALADLCQQLASVLAPDVPVLCAQNGLGIVELVQSKLPNPIHQLIVPFNVLKDSNGCYQQTSGGELYVAKAQALAPFYQALTKAGLSFKICSDMRPVVYGKLLLNLNNALNAISDLPLRQQLLQRPWRQLLSKAMREWLAYCDAQKVPLTQFTQVSPRWLPWLLLLPDVLFHRIAKAMLHIDPTARLSMWHDLQNQRLTEIDFLNGAVVRHCEAAQLPCATNQLIYDLIVKRSQGVAVEINPKAWLASIR